MTIEMEEAIRTLKYGKSLDASEGRYTALYAHIALWENHEPDNESDMEYVRAVREIKSKLFTEECYLK